MSKSNMQILTQMVAEDKDISVSINQMTDAVKVKQGGKITIGVDAKVFDNVSKSAFGGEMYHVLLFVVNAKQYSEIMNS